MSAPRRRWAVALATVVLFAVATSCSTGGDDKADDGTTIPEAATTTAAAPDGGPAEPTLVGEDLPFVQDLWLYKRLAKIDEDGRERDLTDDVLALLGTSPAEVTSLGGDVSFQHHDELPARLVGPTVRPVTMSR